MQTRKAIDKASPLIANVKKELAKIIRHVPTSDEHEYKKILKEIENNLDQLVIDLIAHEEPIVHIDDIYNEAHDKSLKFSEVFEKYQPIQTSDLLYRRIEK